MKDIECLTALIGKEVFFYDYSSVHHGKVTRYKYEENTGLVIHISGKGYIGVDRCFLKEEEARKYQIKQKGTKLQRNYDDALQELWEFNMKNGLSWKDNSNSILEDIKNKLGAK